jgi:20S proteasome alpha/beta subunit
MTCCIAALADEGKSLVLVSDRMIGNPYIEGEPNIRKFEQVHEDWWVLFAGSISPCIDIIGRLKKWLPAGPLDVETVAEMLSREVEVRWTHESEAAHLRPRGWSKETFFKEACASIPESLFRDIEQQYSWHHLDSSIIIAGFDNKQNGHVLSAGGFGDDKFKVSHYDIPGYTAIGSGAAGALYMMSYKDVSSKMCAREAAYYALEGKWFGELASGVGSDTDVVIVRPGYDPLKLEPEVFDEKFFPICKRLGPKSISKSEAINLNNLPELEALGKIDMSEYDKKPKKSNKKDNAKTVES